MMMEISKDDREKKKQTNSMTEFFNIWQTTTTNKNHRYILFIWFAICIPISYLAFHLLSPYIKKFGHLKHLFSLQQQQQQQRSINLSIKQNQTKTHKHNN